MKDKTNDIGKQKERARHYLDAGYQRYLEWNKLYRLEKRRVGINSALLEKIKSLIDRMHLADLNVYRSLELGPVGDS